MAQIILKPNESFEHTHSKDSYSSLEEGEAILKMGDQEIQMEKGKKYPIPANVSHTIWNKSLNKSMIGCLH